MLAFAPLPAPGSQLGNDILISSDGLNALHELSIILDDQTTPGFVTATITTKVDGAADQTAQYFNFGGIFFAGVNDTDGSVVNRVSLWTSYDADLVGNEIAPSSDAAVGLSTDWETYNQFPLGISLGTTVLVNTLNADSLTVTSGILGGGASTIVGEFESPTLPENIDPTNPDTYANISLFSGVGIATNATKDAVVATALTLKSQTQGIDLGQDVFTKYDLNMEAAQDITLSGLVEVKEGDVSLFSSSGSIAVLELIHAMAGSITIDSDCDEVEIERLCAFKDITINAPQGVVVFEELRSENGGVTITADAGPIQMLGDIFTQTDFRMTAAEEATLWGVVEVTAGDVVIESTSDEVFIASPVVHAVGGSIELVALTGVRRFSGILGIDVVVPGSVVSAVAPVVSVVVAPPASGVGRRATAFATVAQIGTDEDGVPIWGISRITVLDPGDGYADGESPVVTINGLDNAEAEAVIRRSQDLVAEVDIVVRSGGVVNLVDLVRADTGDISITAVTAITTAGAILSAPQGLIAIAGEYSADLGEMRAGEDVTVVAARGVIAGQPIISIGGDVSLTSVTESVTTSGLIEAEAVTFQAVTGLAVAALGTIVARSGDVVATVSEGAISLQAEILARQGDIEMTSRGFFQGGRGVAAIEIFDIQTPTYIQGQGAGYTPGATRVIVSPPRNGGIAATALPVIGPYQGKDGAGNLIFETTTIFNKDGSKVQIKTLAPPIQGGINSVLVTSPGSGYELGEEVTVQFLDPNATKLARGRVTLQSTIPLSRLIADAGEIRVKALTSDLLLQTAHAKGDVVLDALRDVAVTGDVKAGGSIISLARTGGTSAQNLFASDSIDITSLATVSLAKELYAEQGDIEVESLSGGISMTANVQAEAGAVRLKAHREVTQGLIGIEEIRVVSGGTGYAAATVTIAPPAAGGVAATGRAVISPNGDGAILAIEVVTVGSGYSPGEIVEVTIAGAGDGASAFAVASSVVPMIVAETELTVDAGLDVSLVNSVRSNAGNLAARTIDGDLRLDSPTLVLHAPAGTVTLETKAGMGAVGQVVAEEGITIRTLKDLTLSDTIVSHAGPIFAASSAGDVLVNAIVSSENDSLTIDAFNQVRSTSGVITRIVVVNTGFGYEAETTQVVINRSNVRPTPDGGQTAGSESSVAATARAVVDEQGRIVAIDIVTPGRGYLPDEQVEVTIEGEGAGATAVAFADLSLQTLSAKTDIDVRAGLDLALVGPVRSAEGAITVQSVTGDVDLAGEEVRLHALAGPVTVRSKAGGVTLRQITAGESVVVESKLDVALVGQIGAAAGDISFATTHGDLRLSNVDTSIVASQGSVSLTSEAGKIATPAVMSAGQKITVEALEKVRLLNTIEARSGAIDVLSRGGEVEVSTVMSAANDSIRVRAFTDITSFGGGISAISLVSGGINYTEATTRITISAPGVELNPLTGQLTAQREGSKEAVARAVVDQFGRITEIVIEDPGLGYLPEDRPQILIEDIRQGFDVGAGASATVVVEPPPQVVSAAKDVLLEAGGKLTLIGTVRAVAGDVQLKALSGDVVLNEDGSEALLQSLAGDIWVVASAGAVSLKQLTAGDAVTVISKLDLRGFGPIDAGGGDIDLLTTHGDIRLDADGTTIVATKGSIRIRSEAGDIRTPEALRAFGGLALSSHSEMSLLNTLVAETGAIDIESRAGDINLSAVITAENNAISLAAFGRVKSSAGQLTGVTILAQGSGYLPSTTLVTIAAPGQVDNGFGGLTPPRENSRPALGRAVVDSFGRVTAIEIVDPGEGYRENEQVRITIADTRPTGGPQGRGANALGVVNPVTQIVRGQGRVDVRAGSAIALVGIVESLASDVSVTSTGGDIAANNASSLLQAVEGKVQVSTSSGGVGLGKVISGDGIDVNATSGIVLARPIEKATDPLDRAIFVSGGDITLRTIQGDLSLSNQRSAITSTGGSVSLVSESGQVFSPLETDVQNDLFVRSHGNMFLTGRILVRQGGIDAESLAAAVAVNATVSAPEGKIRIVAYADMETVGGGITELTIVNSGIDYSQATFVRIARPRSGGGRQARARVVVEDTRIVRIEIVDPGLGYSFGESPEVEVEDPIDRDGDPRGQGAEIIAISRQPSQSIAAGEGVELGSGDNLSVFGTVRTTTGDIRVRSIAGDVDMAGQNGSGGDVPTLLAEAGGVAVSATAGAAVIADIVARGDVSVQVVKGLAFTGVVESQQGEITLGSSSGSISMADTVKVHAQTKSIAVSATAGEVSTINLIAGQNVTVFGEGDVSLNGMLHAIAGDVSVTSSGAVDNASRLEAGGSVDIVSGTAVKSLGGGIVTLELLSGGNNYEWAIVDVAAPASGGGRAALARAIITANRITALELVDPGFGYAPGERVEVSFRGNPRREAVGGVGGVGGVEVPPGEGALAVAFAADEISLIHAGENVSIRAVTSLELGTELIAQGGDLDLNVTAGSLRVTDAYAEGEIDIVAMEGIGLRGNVRSDNGSIAVESLAGGLDLFGTVLAPNGGVVIETASQIVQRGGSIRPDGLYLISGGRGYTFAELAVDPPPGAGQTALARAVITAYDPPVLDDAGFRLGYISDVVLLDGGWGYPSDSIVNVSIVDGDGEGGRIVFKTTVYSSSVEARDDVSLRSGDSITLISSVRSAQGDVAISNTLGNVAVQTIKAGGDISVESANGDVTLVSVAADGGATLRARQEVTVTDSVNANLGDVVIEARNKDVRFLPINDVNANLLETEQGVERVPSAVIASQQGSVTLTSFNGAVESPYAINAAKDITLNAFTTLTLDNVITSQAGNVVGKSNSGRIAMTSTISAHDGSITLDAHTRLQQDVKSGVTKIELLSPGPMVLQPPEVIVTVAPPQNGGTAATAGAIIDRRPLRFGFDDDVLADDNNDVIPYEYFIRAIAILDPGSGYEVGEQPLVTIEMFVDGEEIFGALARAFGPTFVPMIVADDNVTLRAGEDVILVNNVRANTGDIAIQSKDGDLVLVAPIVEPAPDAPPVRIRRQLVHALQGDILLETLAGKIEYQDIIAAQDITMRSHETLTINNPLTTNGGDVTLVSTGNDVVLEQNVLAADLLTIKAKTGIAQTGGLVKATDLYVENITPTAITLANAANDVDRFAAKNVGDVTYNDANEFRVGLRTSGPMTVEVTGASVSLSATDTIRVVAGIKATKLALLADTVEFVTTAAADNHLPNAAFTGTFRDMIAISNANTILTSEHEFVFDEPGYPISEITVRGALPAFTRPVRVDGTTATGGRLGVLGSAGVATGVRLGVGSSGSEFTGAAFYGFSSGSAFVIDSSSNTVSDLYFGLRADGSAAPANRIGVNASGARAFSNVIGSALEFDELTANRFAGHTDAAIVIQRGASNNLVAGNIVGGQGMTANRNGVRIDGGGGNRIGTAAQVTPDLRPTESNRIVGNTHYGIEIRNVRGATTVVENNVVSGNATATGSGTHGIGVLNSAFVTIGGVSELARNQIFSQLGGSGVHLSGSNNVRILGNAIGTDGWHLTANSHTNDFDANRPDLGNGVHGIHVFGRSRDVLIDANRIVDNGASGVAIAAGSSGVVLTNNEIGAWVHPVTGNVHDAGNTDDGVRITAANGNTIGAGNVIGFNGGTGIMVENSVAAGLATGNRIFGAEVFRNAGHGVHISGSSRQTVGGTTAGVGNIVKENGLDGIRIETDPRMRASAAPFGNLVAGNFVGTNDNEEIDRSWGNRAGIVVVNGVQNVVSGNVVMNNRSHGVEMSGGNSNTLGGGREADTNFIGYNDDHGIFVHDQASTDLPVGVLSTTITNGGAGYSASRARVIFSAPAASGGMAARGVAIISAAGRVTEIRLTSSGTGYELGEAVSVTVFDPQATVQVTATVTLGLIAAVNQVTRDHVISGNEIEANRGGIGIYVQGEAVTGIQIGQDFNARSGPGRGNKISFHEGFGVLVNAAGRVGVQGNELGNNGMPMDFINANPALGAAPILHNLRSIQWGRGQTLVTGTITGGGAFHEYWVDVYSTPYWDLRDDANDTVWGHQMRTYLGRTLVTTDANGNATIRWTLSEAVALGDSISATLTSNRYEDGATVGVWHSDRPHAVDLSAAPTTGSPTVTPTSPSGGTTTPTRGPVAPRG